ncbi:hypothetical protein CSKR_105606 [Clonorchis sinensis]|uniref:Uncharacterized protein n=1 Tax=Clonorchis sinensis TaxID=79923 RepID=A0A419PNN6_CLOSI|nr:hypothetical protein CSKR_105606 [Clonorchis sinensis]
MSPKKGETGRGLSKNFQQPYEKLRLTGAVYLLQIHPMRAQQLEHEAAWCSTFSCLKTSQTGDSAGFQNIRLMKTRELRLPDELQEGRNRSWAVEKFSATL